MHDTTAMRRPEGGAISDPRYVALQRRFPTVHYLRNAARRNLPRFAFEYCDGGAGADGGIARNWNALDAVELVPRYGVTTALPPVDVEIFGHRYAAPVGVAPMGGPSLVFPGADAYLGSLLRHGQPRFGNLKPYTANDADVNEVAAFVRREMGGAFTWDEVAKYRERWKGPLVVKGILHPADAEKCVALGVDGIVVSNHGGRQVEGLPAPVDVLPAIARAASGRARLMLDSGIRSGLDVARAVALGADMAFAGKAFLWGLGALGEEGPSHVIDLMIDEMKSAFGQIGAFTPAQARSVAIRHPGALHF